MTDDFDPHLSCETYEKSKDIEGYTTKNIILDSRRYSELRTPIKTADMEGLSKSTLELYSSLSSSISPPLLIDSPKYIWHPRTYEAIHEINEGYVNDTNRVLRILGLKPELYNKISNTIVVSSVVFHRNPFEERITSSGNKYDPLDKSNFETFLQNLYSYSKGMVLVPDINITKVKNIGYTIKAPEYIELIDYFTTILSERNNNPIFVPIQTNLTRKATEKIIESYKEKGYTNIWINFSAGEVRGRNLAGLRTILSLLDKKYDPDEYVIFCSHIRKEMSPHINDEKTSTSDMLSQFVGGDIIGGNREPLRIITDGDLNEYIEKLGFEDKNEYEKAKNLHKNRIFDPSTYFYYTPIHHPNLPEEIFNRTELIKNENKNKALDSYLKTKEVEKVKNLHSQEKKLKDYLKNKTLFKENDKIFKEILDYSSKRSKKTKPLFDF
jgi:hypothetical protein